MEFNMVKATLNLTDVKCENCNFTGNYPVYPGNFSYDKKANGMVIFAAVYCPLCKVRNEVFITLL
jgi:hypothetical protein